MTQRYGCKDLSSVDVSYGRQYGVSEDKEPSAWLNSDGLMVLLPILKRH